MKRNIFITISGLMIGVCIGFFINMYSLPLSIQRSISPLARDIGLVHRNEVIGFLPYWLLDKAQSDYSSYLTTLTYFGLSIDPDGTILKLNNSQELQPGWNAFASGKVTPFLENAKKNNISLSLLLDTGDTDGINDLISDPVSHARNLVHDSSSLLKKNNFSDLNLDIEYTAEASPAARRNFTQFIQTVRKELNPKVTLTVEVSTIDVIKNQLIDVKAVGNIANHIVIMAYDYHSPDSYVTGPVAPLSGAGTVSEYDVKTAVDKALMRVAPEKIILGVPLYGYEWETIVNSPRSAVIPGTGLLASNNRSEQVRASCASCSAQFDAIAQESFISYHDTSTGTYHQIFYPDEQSMQAKIDLANQKNLGGVALWALGYEGKTILEPLKGYIQQ